jgi:hypothetical protein
MGRSTERGCSAISLPFWWIPRNGGVRGRSQLRIRSPVAWLCMNVCICWRQRYKGGRWLACAHGKWMQLAQNCVFWRALVYDIINI